MGKIQKTSRWVPNELNNRQIERCKSTCEILLTRYKKKSFLHHIITSDEKWIYFKNPKYKQSWVDSDAPSTSTAKPKCVVYYELLKSGEAVNTECYKKQLINLNHSLL